LTYTKRRIRIKLQSSSFRILGGDRLKVHENLRLIRKSKGITQVYVAEKLGIPVQTYNGYELGRRNLKADMISKIASILDEPVENFFKQKIYETKNKKSHSA
jgi:transcriptional regulator with XRE-family HTH domain